MALFLPSLLMIAALAATAAHEVQAQTPLRPVDPAAAQPGFFAFRAHLQTVIARRDGRALPALVHKDVKNSFGGNDGVDEFKQVWALDKPGSAVWQTLTEVLALCGSFAGDDRFVAPYVYSHWPAGVDPYGFVAIVGSGVRVRAQPRPDADTLTRLTFEIVERVPPQGPDETWVAVVLPDGRTGHVDKRFARSPLDYRAIFEKSDGRWLMTMLIAGD